MKKLRKTLIFLLLCLPIFEVYADFDYTHYDNLLKRYLKKDVKIVGIPVTAVDYASIAKEMKRDGSDYLSLLSGLKSFNPERLKNRKEKMAFWINAYNVGAMKTILDFYPVDSIQNRKINLLGSPWKRKVINIGNKEYSLNEIEYDILLEGFRDLRIHFGINCASVSCVNLRDEPYRSDTLYKQLEEQGEDFLLSKEKGMFIDRDKNIVYLSEIFKFDKKHFDEIGGGALNFILPFLSVHDRETLKSGKFKLKYLDYNWTLNDSKKFKKVIQRS